ncbi:MAG: hypothetical protein NC123_15955 [Butyrivibrio sp.]|nr:hypothetical protein [Butyrivibrio sp.]
MFQNIYPVFEAKRLLKKEMLENIRDFPRNLFDLQYRTYSDGILTGCDIKGSETGLTILPGIVLYRGVPYFLDKTYPVSCRAEGRQVYVKVHFWDKAIGAGGEEFLSQIVVDEQEPDGEQELELARFKLQPGARLRSEYVNFYDYETEFDTVIRIHAPYAAPGHIGIWPQICQSFVKELMKYPVTDIWDSAFCLNCLQLTEAMPYEALRTYLNMRLGRNREYTNEQVYAALKGILRENGGKREESGFSQKKEGTLFMI